MDGKRNKMNDELMKMEIVYIKLSISRMLKTSNVHKEHSTNSIMQTKKRISCPTT
jgi:hypothetical protein